MAKPARPDATEEPGLEGGGEPTLEESKKAPSGALRAVTLAGDDQETSEPQPRAPIDWKSLKVDVDAIAARPAKPTRKFWLGTRRDCPLQNVVVGPCLFALYSGVFEVDTNRKIVDADKVKRGIVLQLNEDAVKAVADALAVLIVRRNGTQTWVFNKTSANYDPQPQKDQPLACYLFMVELPRLLPEDWREREPPPIARARP